MAEIEWYYAKGQQQFGPLSPSQLKGLADTGKLRPADLVWNANMSDWAPARSVSGLFSKSSGSKPLAPTPRAESAGKGPPAPPERRQGDAAGQKAAQQAPPADAGETPPAIEQAAEPAEQPIAVRPAPRTHAARRKTALARRGIDLGRLSLWAGYLATILGLLLVVSMRGCKSFSALESQYAESRLRLEKAQFDQLWRDRRNRLNEQLKLLEDDELLTAEEKERQRADIRSKLTELSGDRAQAEQSRQVGLWQDLEDQRINALARHGMRLYWYEFWFWIGAAGLAVGLFAVGINGRGAQRWVCLTLLALLVLMVFGGQVGLAFRARP